MADETPIVPEAPEETPLDLQAIRTILKGIFPNHPIQQGWKVGGALFTVSVWQFQLEISLNMMQVSHCDSKGDGMVLFTFIPPNKSRPIEIKKEAVKSLEQLVPVTNWVKEYLNGVAAAIIMSFEAAPPAPKAKLF
jgi:hypothetical protein